ncbi:MAG: N-acetylmuramoyl-L-alanine amidase [Patescibacteria group bacterium]
MRGPSITRYFIIGAIAILAVVFLSPQVQATVKQDVQKGEISFSNIEDGKTSGIIESEFPFQMIGLAWRGSAQTNVELRYNNSDGWSEWYPIDEQEEINGWFYSREPIISNGATKFQYSVISGQIDELKLIYLGTSEKISFNKWNPINLFHQASAEENVDIVTRPEWEADESLRYDGANIEIWPTQYQAPQKFVVHHTAGGDGGNDPEGTIRGIYYWHSTVLGWGDIGYNYLIDQNGIVYEGRYGGDGAIGAHAYRNRTCAISRFGGEQFEANFNAGTVGIAVLGDYESMALNSAVRNALTSLMANKARDLSIEPNGASFLIDNTYPNIVGHKDLDCTLCPGVNLYQELSGIRSETQILYDTLSGSEGPIVKAEFIKQSGKTVSVSAGLEKEVWVEFKNTGNVIWQTGGQYSPYIIPSSSISSLQASNWESQLHITSADNSSIAPGETGRFTFSVKGPLDQLELAESFKLVINDNPVSGTDFVLKIKVTGLPYAAKLASNTIKPAMFAGSQQTVIFKFRNQGTSSWERGNVYLNIYDLGDKVSRLASKNWPDQFGNINFSEAVVNSGETATFTFDIKAPLELGLFKNIYRIIGPENVIQNNTFSKTRIDSQFSAELVSHTIPSALLNYWRLPVVVKFKNTGLSTWNKTMVLQMFDLGGKSSVFYDSTWGNSYGNFVFKENEVKPGKVGTFNFYVKSPKKTGIYLNTMKLGIIGREIVVQGGETMQKIRIDK